MLIGPAADYSTIEEFRRRIEANPRNYIAQPVISLSRVPSYDTATGCMAGRHVDLRPYCLVRRRESNDRAGWIDARGPAARFTGGQFIAGWRQQRHLGFERGDRR